MCTVYTRNRYNTYTIDVRATYVCMLCCMYKHTSRILLRTNRVRPVREYLYRVMYLPSRFPLSLSLSTLLLLFSYRTWTIYTQEQIKRKKSYNIGPVLER